MTRYLLDANVFIEAKNRHYGFDICPAFWDWLIERNDTGQVTSLEKVYDEIKAGGDELSDWAKAPGRSLFLPPDDRVFAELEKVSTWATSEGYEPVAVSTFLRGADCWLVAHALAHDYVLVTHEIRSDSKKKVKIPNACDGLHLRSINPYDMLRHEGARFVLGKTDSTP